MKFSAELWQDGMCVASVDAATEEDMQREIHHYALVYSQDGPVKIVFHATESHNGLADSNDAGTEHRT